MSLEVPQPNPYQRFLEAKTIITGRNSFVYYDIRGVAFNNNLKPIGICPLYMRVDSANGMVLPAWDIFMNQRHLSPEDYEFYILRLFKDLPRAVKLKQSEIWGDSLTDDRNQVELTTLADSARRGTPIAIASYNIIQNDKVKPKNTLAAIYHLPQIRTQRILELMGMAFNDGMAHVWGLEY